MRKSSISQSYRKMMGLSALFWWILPGINISALRLHYIDYLVIQTFADIGPERIDSQRDS